MSARAAILDRVRRAQATGHVPRVDAVAVDLTSPRDPAVALERFVTELTAVGVENFVEASDDAVRARVQAIVGGREVLRWDDDRLPYGVAAVLPGASTGGSARDVQAAATVGVTGCAAAIAETGSLAMLSGAGMPRSASLLPPVHLAIVRRGDIRFSLGQFLAERADDIAAAACCYFITGPSRTADIELTLTLGVHGPGQVFVVVGP